MFIKIFVNLFNYVKQQWKFSTTILTPLLWLARNVSPINYVRSNLPPILTIHGDKDTFVPYTHAVKLHQKLDKIGVTNKLFSVRGAAHGGFSKQQKQQIYTTIKEFLMQHKLISIAK